MCDRYKVLYGVYTALTIDTSVNQVGQESIRKYLKEWPWFRKLTEAEVNQAAAGDAADTVAVDTKKTQGEDLGDIA